MKPRVQELLDSLFSNYPSLMVCRESIVGAFECLVSCYKNKGKVLVCGNGGSAADAEHIVGELMKSFVLDRTIPEQDKIRIESMHPANAPYLTKHLQRALPAICLSSHTGLTTAFGNDVGSDMVFAQQVYGYGQPNDLLIALSTSGKSANICHAARVASAMGLSIIGMTGQSGGILKDLCTVNIAVPSSITYKIQELHLPVYHMLCLMIEEEWFGK